MFFSPARLSLALSLVSCLPGLQAQDSGNSGQFFNDYLTFLNSTGYTALSSALERAQSTDSGKQWINQLSSGQWTVFAPSNQAFSSAPSNASSNSDTLADYLSYHYVYGNALSSQNSSAGGGAGAGASSSMSGSSSSQSQSASSQSGGGGGGGSQTSSPQSSETASGNSRRAFWFKPQSLQSGNGSSNGSLGSVTAMYPNATIGRTLLSDNNLVRLEGPSGNNSRHQVLAWSQSSQNGVFVLNQAQNTTVGNTTTWRNLLIANVDQVLIPPGNVSAALTSINDTALLNLLNTVQVPSSGESSGNVSALQAFESAQGFTFFAPSEGAFTSEFNNSLQGLQNNQSALATLLQNHYANGTTRYSPSLYQLAQGGSSGSGGNSSSGGMGGNSTGGGGGMGGSSGNSTGGGSSGGGSLVSAAGEPFTFSQNDTGLFVSNGNGSSAQIVRPDILVQNGVIHLIDRFLINEQSNPAAASSAIASESAAATDSSTDTAIMGIATGGSQASMSQSSSSSGSQSQSQSSTQTETSTTGGGGSSSTASAASGFRFARYL